MKIPVLLLVHDYSLRVLVKLVAIAVNHQPGRFDVKVRPGKLRSLTLNVHLFFEVDTATNKLILKDFLDWRRLCFRSGGFIAMMMCFFEKFVNGNKNFFVTIYSAAMIRFLAMFVVTSFRDVTTKFVVDSKGKTPAATLAARLYIQDYVIMIRQTTGI